MSSSILYPPIVNSYESAFVVSDSSLTVHFSSSSLSNLPSGVNVEDLTAHARIYKKDDSSVLNTTNDYSKQRYRSTGMILNLPISKDGDKDNYYYIEINSTDLKAGWEIGAVYKIQIRLSLVSYVYNNQPKQEVWLQENSSNFSEWSSVCYTKAIDEMELTIPMFSSDSKTTSDTVYTVNAVNLCGSLKNKSDESNEFYDHINIYLYENSDLDNPIETSDDIVPTDTSPTFFEYNFKTNFIYGTVYTVFIDYETENGYKPDEKAQYNFIVDSVTSSPINALLTSIDTNYLGLLDDVTCLLDEEDEGRIGLKIYSPDTDPWSGNVCIRRASQVDNFKTWEDIKIFAVKEQDLNEVDMIYDYTIKSGVWYKYGIQSIDKYGSRSELVEMSTPIQRLFNHSFLLGRGGKQLKLEFNNTMNSFKHQIYDSKTDTIGSQYSFISRNAAVNYKTFPFNALISYQMDESNTFLTKGKKDLYNYDAIVELYDDYAADNNRYDYDYTYERDFREKVIEFLQDGKPKLFKSPTEGNIIIRLVDVNFTPNQTLDRMLYSVTATAYEIAEDTMQNYKSYGFYDPGTYSGDLSTKTYKIGQISGEFLPTDNIFEKIYKKYDSQGENYGGYSKKLETIERVCITINGYYYTPSGASEKQLFGRQLRVLNNNNEVVLGNNISVSINGSETQLITIYDPRGMYEFDSLISFVYKKDSATNSKLYLLGDEEGIVESVDATIDFIYSITSEVYEEHTVKTQTPVRGIAQFYGEVNPGESIYNTIYYTHYVNSSTQFRYLNNISSIEIEADPHTIFAITDGADSKAQYHEINDTGILRLYEINNITGLKYIGRRYFTTDYDDNTLSSEIITKSTYDDDGHYIFDASADVSVTYRYSDIFGTYKSSN